MCLVLLGDSPEGWGESPTGLLQFPVNSVGTKDQVSGCIPAAGSGPVSRTLGGKDGRKQKICTKPLPGSILGTFQTSHLILRPASGHSDAVCLWGAMRCWDVQQSVQGPDRRQHHIKCCVTCGNEAKPLACLVFSTQVDNLYFYTYLIMNDCILSSEQLGKSRLTWFSSHIFKHLDPPCHSSRVARPLLAAPTV